MTSPREVDGATSPNDDGRTDRELDPQDAELTRADNEPVTQIEPGRLKDSGTDQQTVGPAEFDEATIVEAKQSAALDEAVTLTESQAGDAVSQQPATIGESMADLTKTHGGESIKPTLLPGGQTDADPWEQATLLPSDLDQGAGSPTAVGGATRSGGSQTGTMLHFSPNSWANLLTVRFRNVSLVSPEVAAVTTAPGASDSEYQLGRMLGRGGMGAVFRARQGAIDRRVAVKMILPGKDQQPVSISAKERFVAEAVITGALEHPNIVPVYDLGADARGDVFYAMKEVKGRPWTDSIDQASEPENLDVLMRVADAIAFAHEQGVVHRDLKPDNVMIGAFGEVLVMDWGLALPTERFQRKGIPVSGGLAGTPHYMAPEMAHGRMNEIGPASDIYLLGGLLFRFLTGKTPHTGRHAMECLEAARSNVLAETDRDDELLAIALKAMATKPADRYATVSEFQQALKDYRTHAESHRQTRIAHDQFVAAQTDRDFRRLDGALLALDNALTLWPDNDRAGVMLREVRRFYAGQAFERGDFDLAERQLTEARLPSAPADTADLVGSVPGDAEELELLDRIRHARRERELQGERLRRRGQIIKVTVSAALLILTVAVVMVTAARNREAIARAEAETRFGQSRDAIERLTYAADALKNYPRMQTFRAGMLGLVAGYYDELTSIPTSSPQTRLDLVLTRLRQGDVHAGLAEFQQADDAYVSAIDALRDVPAALVDAGADPLLTARLQLRRSNAQLPQRRLAEAEALATQAIDELNRALAAARLPVRRMQVLDLLADAHLTVARIAQDRSRLEAAQNELDRVMEISSELLAALDEFHAHRSTADRAQTAGGAVSPPQPIVPNADACRMRMARAVQTSGQVAVLLGDETRAIRLLADSLDIWQTQVELTPDDVVAVEGLAITLGDVAHLRRMTGHDAVPVAKQTVVTWQRLVDARPELPGYRFNLATALSNLAWHQNRLGLAEAAMDTAASAVQHMVRLANEYPQDQRYLEGEAATRIVLGEVLRDRGDLELSQEMLAEAVELLETLRDAAQRTGAADSSNGETIANAGASSEGEVRLLQERIAEGYSQLARLLEASGDPETARTCFDRSLEAAASTLQDQPDSLPRVVDLIAWTHLHRALFEAGQGQTTAAQDHMRQALELRSDLASDGSYAVWDENFAWLLLQNPVAADDDAQRDAQRALNILRSITDRVPDNDQFWRTRALAELRTGDLEACRSSMATATARAEQRSQSDDGTAAISPAAAAEHAWLLALILQADPQSAPDEVSRQIEQARQSQQQSVPFNHRLECLAGSHPAAPR